MAEASRRTCWIAYPELHGPALLIWADLDKSIVPEHRKAVTEALSAQRKTYVNLEFSNADHGFFCARSPLVTSAQRGPPGVGVYPGVPAVVRIAAVLAVFSAAMFVLQAPETKSTQKTAQPTFYRDIPPILQTIARAVIARAKSRRCQLAHV